MSTTTEAASATRASSVTSTVDEGGRVAQKAAASSSAQLVYTIVFSLLNLGSYLAIVHHLAKDSFGDFALVTFISGLIALVPNSSLEQLAVREITQGADERSVLANIVTARLLLSVVCVGLNQLAFLGVGLARGDVNPTVHLAGLIASSLYFSETLYTVVAVFRARLRQQYETIARLVGVLVKTVVILALVAADAPMWTMLAGSSAGELVGSVVAVWLARRHFGTRLGFAVDRLRWVLSEAVPLCASLVLGGGFVYFDTIFVGATRPAEDVATYSVAVQLMFYAVMFGSFVGVVAYPLLSARWGNDKTSFDAVNRATFDLAIGVYIPLAVVLCTVDLPAITAGVFGEGYRASAEPLRLLSIAAVMLTVIHWQSFVLLAVGRNRERTVISAVTLALTVLFNVILVPRYGVAGAGYAAVVSAAIGMPIALYASWRAAATAPLWSRSARIVIANAALGAVVLGGRWFDLPTLVTVAVALGVAYPAALLATRVVEPAKLKALWVQHAAAAPDASAAPLELTELVDLRSEAAGADEETVHLDVLEPAG